jgi:hypothetical protein
MHRGEQCQCHTRKHLKWRAQLSCREPESPDSVVLQRQTMNSLHVHSLNVCRYHDAAFARTVAAQHIGNKEKAGWSDPAGPLTRLRATALAP